MRPERHRSLTRGVATGLALAIGAMTGLPSAVAGFNDGSIAARSTFAAVPDWLAPEVSTQAVGKSFAGSAQYLANSIKPGGTYYVYANVADSGNPALGVSAVTADVSAISTGRSAEPLVSGSYSVQGTTYNYRTAAIPADASLSGTKSYSIASTDGFNTPRVQSYTVTVDNAAPTATNIATGNAGGGNSGLAETGDTITFTFSERVDPQSIVSGWTGASTNVVVQLDDGGCTLVLCSTDSFRIYNAAYSATLPFGTVDLGTGGYYGCAAVGLLCSNSPTAFGATGTPSTMVQSTNTITITLGTRSGGSGSVRDVGSASDMSWDSTTTPYDAAGNTASGNTVTEADNDFEF